MILLALITLIHCYFVSVLLNHQRKLPEQLGANKVPESVLTQLLDNVEWDFSDCIGAGRLDNVHPYPAKFISAIPGTLLDILPIPPGTVVLDPFCGSGTTLVESQKRGISSIGIDLNPIACLISRVKTAPRPRGLNRVVTQTAERAEQTRVTNIPIIPRLDHWFSDEAQIALTALSDAIEVSSPSFREILRLALSSIVVRVSKQESDTRYVAIEKKISVERVFREFRRAAIYICEALGERNYHLAPAKVFQSDTLTFRVDELRDKVGMVITSPPYPNAYEYWLYHKYRMYWLGFDPKQIKEKEIGARAHFFKSNPHTADDFATQMKKTFHLIERVLTRNGYVCFVIGRSRIHGKIVDNSAILEGVASSVGFQKVFSAHRTMLAKRKSFNLSHANIKTENVIVLRRT